MNPKMSTKMIQRGLWMGALLLTAATASANTELTFTVDMSAQIANSTFVPGTDTVTVSGTFNGWNSTATPLSQVGSTSVYTGTANDTSDPNGGTMSWKIVCSDSAFSSTGGYENTADYNNRTLTLPVAGGSYNVPYVYYNDAGPAVSPAINVTFNVDMGVEQAIGNWAPSDGVVVKGNFNGWGGTAMNQVGSSTVYSVTIPVSTSTNGADDFKYTVPNGYLSTVNSGYENVSGANSDGGGNRWFYTSPTYANLATVKYDDLSGVNPEEYLSSTVNVTFNVDMTGAVGNDGYVFGSDSSIGGPPDVVCINGVYNGSSPNWETWTADGSVSEGQPFIAGPLTGLTMNQVGSSSIWTITLPMDTGNFDELVYKYSINGWDDEAGFNDNHNRWIRNTMTGNWTMPNDVFGSQGNSSSEELAFGNLVIAPNGSHVAITWVGHNGVELQSASSPTGPWTTIPATDGTVLGVSDPSTGLGTATYSVSINPSASAVFYELIQPGE